jgi:diguanylate cyclase (GGDEF)-like protein
MDEPRNEITSQKLLVLDDEPLTAETITQMARFNGYLSEFVTDPDLFFKKVYEWSPDIIALDLMMPKMDGVQVMEKLAQEGCKAKLIITSGVGGRVLDAAGRSAQYHGLDILGILSKPFNATKLAELLKSNHNHRPNVRQYEKSFSSEKTEKELLNKEHLLELLNSHDQLQVVYQPKVYCKTGTLSGVEALVRWEHPTLGKVKPDQFIPLFEKFHLIDELTKKIARKAIDWLAEKSSAAHAEKVNSHIFQTLKLSLNISAVSLNNRDLFDWLFDYCEQKQIESHRLVLELTESSAMEDATASLDNLTRLRMRGFQLSIDDFGTGYSSMVQLVRLPFSEIKVDKSFVINAATSEESQTIIRSIIDLGHSLGMNTTAEGIEDHKTLQFLKNISCQQAQGFLIAAPIMAEEVSDWFVRREALREKSRIEALSKTGLLDSLPEERFDRITRLAQQLFKTPIALVSLVDENRQWFKSKQGISVTETPRDIAFCSKAIETDKTLVIPDAVADERFKNSALVTGEPHIRFYAGHPITLPDGNKVGTLCVIDNKPRTFSQSDQDKLSELAQMVEHELGMHTDDEAIEYHTGLLSRDTFKMRVETGIKLCRRLHIAISFFSIQLRGLATINDRFGVESGDLVIKKLAEILQKLTPQADLIGRYRNTRLVLEVIGLTWEEAKLVFKQLNEHMLEWEKAHADVAEQLNCKLGWYRKVPNEEDTFERLVDNSFTNIQPSG